MKGSKITVSKGVQGEKFKTHILVTSIGYIKNLLPSGGRGNDKNIFSKVKLIIFDEADEIFKPNNNDNLVHLNSLIVNHLRTALGLNP